MKLLLTGKPRIGKTSLIEGFLHGIAETQGFVTKEIHVAGERVGFEVVPSTGQTATLALVDSPSTIRVARYGVEAKGFDDFIRTLPTLRPHVTTYVDEISEMQLHSGAFREFVMRCLDMDSFFIGTITCIYHDDFIDSILARDDVVVIEVGTENISQITRVLNGLATNLSLLESLDPVAQSKITQLAKTYAKSPQTTQLVKLFTNTIKYVAESRVHQQSPTSYVVNGDTSNHTVTIAHASYSCDCDLFHGVGQYAGNPGECSHIQAVKVTT